MVRLWLAGAFSLTLLVVGCSRPGSSHGLPNIVVILADDMGFGDIEAYNPNSRIPTPNLNRLSSEGMRFTDAHTASSVCTPSRYALLTGRYAWRTDLKKGVLWGYSTNLLEPGRPTLASLLKQKGYRTAVIGKWHLGLGHGEQTDYSKPLRPGPNDFGFDYFYGIPASLDMQPYLYVENEHAMGDLTETVEGSAPRREGGGGFWRGGPATAGFRHEDVLPELGNRAVDYLERSSAAEGPFFLYLALTAPHTPWLPTREFQGKSGAGFYGDFAHQVDWTVGQVMDTLERTAQSEDTLLIFTSDNGAHWLPEDIARFQHRANSDWKGQKADIWEGGHRVPFVVRWPGNVKPGSVNDQLIGLIDLFATLAELLDRPLAEGEAEDSFSFLPGILGLPGSTEPTRTEMVHHSVDGMFAIRRGSWKLIMGKGSGGFTPDPSPEEMDALPPGQLYNLESDPAEQVNLYEEHPLLVVELTSLLEDLQKNGRSRP